ncbi:MAG: class I SAM-dependent methyltransferase [Minisyncoccia bacterium]
MNNYKNFSKYYDMAMGDRTAEGIFIKKLIKQYNSKAKTVLELGCGTGAFLKYLSNHGYKMAGIDLSQEMLEIARQKVPNANLLCQNMAIFSLQLKFDVVLCLFDSINHLIDYNDWEKVFLQTYLHLNDSGLFIFDINTKSKLDILAGSDPIVNEVDNKIISMKVILKNNIYNWNIKIVEKQPNDSEMIYLENIQEQSFPISMIEKSLKKNFEKVIKISQSGMQATENSRRVYFICLKNLENKLKR